MHNSHPRSDRVTGGAIINRQWQVSKDIVIAVLLAQGGALQLFIVAVGVVFVGEQRRDAYYRNNPSKYGLNDTPQQFGLLCMFMQMLVGHKYNAHAQSKNLLKFHAQSKNLSKFLTIENREFKSWI